MEHLTFVTHRNSIVDKLVREHQRGTGKLLALRGGATTMQKRREFNRELRKHRALRSRRCHGAFCGGEIIETKETKAGKALPAIRLPSGAVIYPDGDPESALIGDGAAGYVFAYDKSKVLKLSEDDSDVRALDQIESTGAHCGQIGGVVVGKLAGDSAVVLDRMQHNALQGRNKLIEAVRLKEQCTEEEACLRVAETIRQQITCLLDKGLYYLDLKSLNVMFNLDDKKYVAKLSLVDLGSIKAEGEAMEKVLMTYNDCGDGDDDGDDVGAKVGCIAYQLGMFLAELISRGQVGSREQAREYLPERTRALLDDTPDTAITALMTPLFLPAVN